MKIIPVIDLKDGVVVHARQGMREQYQPISTSLCQSSDIYKVIDAFLGAYDFETIYIADLNAITHQGDHERLITEVLAFFPDIQFWIDSGYQLPKKYPCNHLPVLGSESYSDETALELKDFNKRFILSLDYSISETLGAKSLFSDPDLWPDTIIIMTLNRVGSNQGPDLVKLNGFCRRYPHKHFIAAGGVRNADDLQVLKQVGVQQALIASALHSGAIRREDIQNL
ncbi:HisA/HisF-related TIM barrel protein [Methylobacter sp. S3L5C]|uniref:HisA/HisF-related TIM barrel protein n=1 Tax=Methylobacter sp. S3L5C TaxID=2839024 RepID=UPI001FAC9993|nr:HisA/HisF-related TIM barrel protein [Methylobacter sp. S3L5C]UOA10364.1 nickel transporter [Methylobacter sp. S3L5C]